MLAVGTDQGVVLWDLARGTELAFLPIGNAWHLMFEPSGDLITSGSIGVQRWPVQLDAGRGEFRIGPPRRLPLPASMRGLPRTDRAGSWPWPIITMPSSRLPSGRSVWVRWTTAASVAVSPDGQWLATGSHSSRCPGLAHHAMARRWPTCPSIMLAEVVFSPDGKWLMTSESPCRLWAVGTWREARQIGGVGLCFSPDGRLVVVMDASKVLRLVETETGRTLARLESPDSCGVHWATFSSRRVAPGRDHQ